MGEGLGQGDGAHPGSDLVGTNQCRALGLGPCPGALAAVGPWEPSPYPSPWWRLREHPRATTLVSRHAQNDCG